jgi:Putative protein-S-isoprenylcysteine methyltransferase
MAKGRLDTLYVAVQFFLFGLFLLPITWPLPQLLPRWFGLAAAGVGLLVCLVAILQLRKNLQAWPSPKEGGVLISHGLFAWVRHPIYSGLFLAFAGWALFTGSLYKLLVACLLLGWFFLKSRYEERLLLAKFPEYRNYRAKTGRFFPPLRLFTFRPTR